MAPYLVGTIAGLTSALLVLGTAYAGMFIIIVTALTSLPIAIASLGWGTRAALSSAVVAVACLAAMAGTGLAAIYAVTAALPVAIAGYELGLARPASEIHNNANDNGLVWFPLGRVLAHLALVIGAGLTGLWFLFGQSLASVKTELADYLTETMRASGQTAEVAEIEAFVEFAVQSAPFAIPALWCLLVVFNLWLGARIIRASGRLSRPWPDLASVEIELPYSLLFAVSAALAVTSGSLGLTARPLAGAFCTAFFLVGLGILHTLLRGKPIRPFVLPIVYVGILLVSLPALVLAAIGALEPLLKLRGRNKPPNRKSGG